MQRSGSNFRLVVRRGPQPNQIYELDKDFLTIGRDVTNDITINDPEVSRHHCRFTRGGGGYTIEDLGSTNGTFVNNQRLTGARPLTSGDTIGLGETITLAYEVVSMVDMGVPPGYAGDPSAPAPTVAAGPVPTFVGRVPPMGALPSPYAPPSAAPGIPPGYAGTGGPQAPVPGYLGAPPPPPAPMYSYEEEPVAGGVGRWIFLSCGCFIVLCIIGTLVALIIIDQTNSWCDIPLVSNFAEFVNEVFFNTPNRCG